ncbi:MAG: phosphate transporter permease subunit PstC, partial [Flavipsychrobacter sp.]|nr:phosphate transporter permease subunit PstC [Flavipsychrobacter sp.]
MNTSVDNDLITRSDNSSGRVIESVKVPAKVSTTKRIKRSERHIRAENVFRRVLVIVCWATIVLVLGIFATLVMQSVLSVKGSGFGYLWGKTWDPVRDIFGAFPFLLGTILTSFLALFISIPFSFSVAIFLGEYYPKGWLPNLLKNTVELIAAVPSVIYGFWGLAVLVPIVRAFETKIGVAPVGLGIFTSSLILAVMIIPYA